MDAFLLDPNVAYMLLVVGLFLALMAILTPGTGLYEIGALFALLLAGWAVYSLPINGWALLALLLGIPPFILAIRKRQRILYLILSILAIVLGSAFLFRGETWWMPAVHPLLAITVSTLAAVSLWFASYKVIETISAQPAHDLESLLGEIGEAKTDIHDQGSVQVAGELWSAQSSQPIEAGSEVQVIAREGFILQVETTGRTKKGAST